METETHTIPEALKTSETHMTLLKDSIYSADYCGRDESLVELCWLCVTRQGCSSSESSPMLGCTRGRDSLELPVLL